MTRESTGDVIVGRRHDVRILRNRPAGNDAPGEMVACFSPQQSERAFERISSWPTYAPTPLMTLSATAGQLGVAQLYCKDEGTRLGLQSFKALGAIYAAVCTLADHASTRTGRQVTDRQLLDGDLRDVLQDVTLTSATDGNHGFSLAHAARQTGCRALIFIPHGVSQGRAQALSEAGAEVVRIDGIYEEAMAAAVEAVAGRPDSYLISDYATEDYTDIPTLCMAGYATMIHEITGQLDGPPPTHLFAPAGCGGLAAAMITAARQLWGEAAPRVVVVEPTLAACAFESRSAGTPVTVAGDLDTIMGGLACAAVSHAAWPTLASGAFAFMTMNDAAAVDAMRWLARPPEPDPAIISGETGAAGFGALLAVNDDRGARRALELTPSSRVLVISCEGATDPALYEELVAVA